MPIRFDTETRRLSQDEFGRLAYDVMRCLFEIHNEMGRFFEEKIYKRALARRFSNVQVEVPIELSFDRFVKRYFLDALVAKGAIFELKAVETLNERHRSQLMHYLLLTEIPRGKLVNLRPELVQHEFVNATLRRADRTAFSVDDRDWCDTEVGDGSLRRLTEAMLRDWGAALDLTLYEEALTHFLGGEERVLQEIDVLCDGGVVGTQKLRLAQPGIAFKVTAIGDEGLPRFEDHLRRFLSHTSLEAIQWINVTRQRVLFQTIRGNLRQKN